MSVKKYRFVSPGVFVNEIDNAQVPASPAGIGPVVIGTAEKGPSLRPVTVNSFEEFVNTFGTPVRGGAAEDVWREGAFSSAPTYGAYAAQAYLKNSSPLTYIRLLGAQTTADGGPSTGTDGEAGWSKNEAYGLFVFHDPSGSSSSQLTGALAAVFYGNTGTEFMLSGAVATSASYAGLPGIAVSTRSYTGSHIVVADTGTNYEFKILIKNASGSANKISTFTANYTETDSRYIRKVFNTNAQKTNAGVASAGTALQYFLGETFDRHLKSNVSLTDIANSATGRTFGSMVKLNNTTAGNGGDFAGHSAQSAQTPTVISCRLSPSTGPQNLFTIHALNEPGDWSNRNIKVSIQDIQRSPTNSNRYGTFSVVVRALSDSDNVVRIIEQFDECDLNPDSLNYVARKVGNKYLEWNESERRYIEKGDYHNNSRLIRLEMNSDVDAGLTNPSLLPFGFRGMVKYDDEETTGASAGRGNWATGSTQLADFPALRAPGTDAWASGSVFAIEGPRAFVSVPTNIQVKALYPAPELRVSASDGNLSNRTDAYFGFQTTQTAGGTVFDKSTIDLLRPRGGIVGNMFAGASAGIREVSVEFTLDDVSGSDGVWISGSHNAAIGGTAGGSLTRANGAISGVLDQGYDRFTVPVYGGFDGVNITEMDPFNSSTRTLPSTATDKNSYAFNSIRRTIDAVADPEVVEMNVATIPGLRQTGLTDNLINTCEDRADALAIIDLPQGYIPRAQSNASAASRRANTASEITQAVNGLRSRGLNSSYGCAFYPWVRGRDTISGGDVWLPPSIPALGTFSSSQRKTQVWFAPAGFNRGGLTEGSAGIPVVDVAHQLRRKDRDDLYSANINPIAKFPAEGIVIFGQKTLQVTPSALDRINVRRLMIFVKKRISQIAAGLLFDPNVKQTWLRFTAQVNPFLQDVQTNFGLSDFKVVLDDSTTTPELIDRNVMYAQIFLKPTRAIEYIAIDFNISRTGASFED